MFEGIWDICTRPTGGLCPPKAPAATQPGYPRVLQQEWPNLGNWIAHQGWQQPPASDTKPWGSNAASEPHFYQKFIMWTTETDQAQVTVPGLHASASTSSASWPFHAQVILRQFPRRTPCYGRSVSSCRPGWIHCSSPRDPQRKLSQALDHCRVVVAQTSFHTGISPCRHMNFVIWSWISSCTSLTLLFTKGLKCFVSLFYIHFQHQTTVRCLSGYTCRYM